MYFARFALFLQQIYKNMTTLYLVRHGETVDNANQIMQGQTQGELNANGLRQAQEFAELWKDRDIDIVMASDLKRSVDTAIIIAEPHGLGVVTTPLLRERDWGGFTGRYIPDLKNEVWPDDIETLENLLSRAGEFIAYVKKTYPGKKVLAVGHGIINKAVQAVYFKKSMRPPLCPPPCEPPPKEPPLRELLCEPPPKEPLLRVLEPLLNEPLL